MSNGAYAGLRMAARADDPRAQNEDRKPDDSDEEEDGREEREPTMASITKEEHDTAIAKASADATAAANARFSAVLASEEYAGREPLAQKLLGNANLSADDIIDTLKAAEKKPVQEAADASSAAAGAEEAARQEMQAELARNKNSNVDANASGEGVGGATDASALWGQAIEANNPGVKLG
jgi:hypothetical protein